MVGERLGRKAKASLIQLGEQYLDAKNVADRADAQRKNVGEEIIAALRDSGVRKVEGESTASEFEPGPRILVSYGERFRYRFEEDALWATLKKHDLVERVTKVVIDENALAELISDDTIEQDVIQKILSHVSKSTTRYPIVKRSAK